MAFVEVVPSPPHSPPSACLATFHGRIQSSAWPYAAPRLDLLFSTAQSPNFFSETSAVFPSDFCLAGSCLCSPAAGRAPPRCCCRCTISLTAPSRFYAGPYGAHRSHFYQRATSGGFRVIDVVGRVFAVNLALAALALVTILLPSRTTDIATLIAGAILVAWLLIVFARGPTAT